MSRTIRSFMPTDYEAISNLQKMISLKDALSVEDLRRQDNYRDQWRQCQRWVVEQNGTVIAVGGYDQESQHYHPQTFVIHAIVHPAYQRQGIASTLYTQVVDALQFLYPLHIKARVRADMPQSISFVTTRGFQERRRIVESYLNLATFASPLVKKVNEQLKTQYTALYSFQDLESDPERDQKLYTLVQMLLHDVPSSEPRKVLSYEDFVHYKLLSKLFLPEAYIIACHHSEYIGLTELKVSNRHDELITGLTAVKQAYRHKDIARALKLHSIAFAKAHGYRAIQTTNDIGNTPILSLNESLSFVKQHIWIEFAKTSVAEQYHLERKN
jgi:ribosomal protein S18 acetylase RimI-like enzyme